MRRRVQRRDPVGPRGRHDAPAAGASRAARRPRTAARAGTGSPDRAARGGSRSSGCASSAAIDAIPSSRPNAACSASSERSMPRLTSLGRTARPVEKRTPARTRERVRAAAVRRRRERLREVGHHLRPRRAAGPPERRQPVVGEAQQHPRLQVVARRRIGVETRRSDPSGYAIRSVPPRCPAPVAATAAQTRPPTTASARGSLPSRNRSVTTARSGSIRASVRARRLATQTPPSPTASADRLVGRADRRPSPSRRRARDPRG